MASLPPSVPYIDLLAPPGSGAAVSELQTRFELMGVGAWRSFADDAQLEQMAPLQPIRGGLERIALGRMQPWNPREPMDIGAQLAVELAITTQASLAAFGVSGTFSWGMVVAEDARWIHGLVLLDWLYNPRISAKGEAFDGTTPEAIKAELSAKIAVFKQLWTPERGAAFARKLPAGALQEIEGYVALMVLSPQATFDPRYWQGFSLQMAVREVRELHAPQGGAAPPGAPATSSAGKVAPAAPSAPPRAGSSATGPVVTAVSSREPASTPPGDGLTALGRARVEAERKAREVLPTAPVATVVEEAEGAPSVRWVTVRGGPLLWVPDGRFDAGDLRSLRSGDHALLRRSEQPPGPIWETWIAGGAAFVTEVPALSRLFLDGVPLHRGTWDSGATTDGGTTRLECQLPRVAPVVAVWVPAEGERPRRILCASLLDLGAAEIVQVASAS